MLRFKPLLLTALLVAGGTFYFMLGNEQPTEAMAPLENTQAEHAELESESTAAGHEAAATDTLRERIEQLKLSLLAATEEREKQEEALQFADREVARLERFVEEIEERGEDPVDYAEEGLAMFQPAFFAYQEASDKLELAESLEQTTAEELAEAENELAKLLQNQNER